MYLSCVIRFRLVVQKPNGESFTTEDISFDRITLRFDRMSSLESRRQIADESHH